MFRRDSEVDGSVRLGALVLRGEGSDLGDLNLGKWLLRDDGGEGGESGRSSGRGLGEPQVEGCRSLALKLVDLVLGAIDEGPKVDWTRKREVLADER